ncbi:MAG: DNA-formamidopyrimidine glycosylase family protein [Candidatus Eisenbacteria bacterium]
MAEGPLVHHNARQLRRVLKGKKVRIEFGVRKLKGLEASLRDLRLDDVEAFGKQFRIRLSDKRIILVHLMMWGYWRVYRKGETWDRPRERARLILSTGSHDAVAFSAPVVRLLTQEDIDRHPTWGNLGPDPLRDDFSRKEFLRRLDAGPSLTIGEAFLDQTIISGVGNILRIEIMFRAKIHPRRKVGRLSPNDKRRLTDWTLRLMKRWLDERGREDEWIRIYRGKSKPCPRCAGRVESFRQAGRITYACRDCQI